MILIYVTMRFNANGRGIDRTSDTQKRTVCPGPVYLTETELHHGMGENMPSYISKSKLTSMHWDERTALFFAVYHVFQCWYMKNGNKRWLRWSTRWIAIYFRFYRGVDPDARFEFGVNLDFSQIWTRLILNFNGKIAVPSLGTMVPRVDVMILVKLRY